MKSPEICGWCGQLNDPELGQPCLCVVEPLEVSRARRAVNLCHREARAAFRVSAKRWGRPAA